MKLEQVREWVARMRQLKEDNIPYLVYNNRFYTPNDILREAENNTPTWQGLQKQLGDPPIEISWELLEERFKKRMEEGRVLPVYKMGKVLTPEDQLKEIKNKTLTGYNILLAEAKLLEELEKIR